MRLFYFATKLQLLLMYKRSSTKRSVKKPSESFYKTKANKSVTVLTPKTVQKHKQRSIQLSKFKTLPISIHSQMVKSLLPLPQVTSQTPQQPCLKYYQSQISHDCVFSPSEKTINKLNEEKTKRTSEDMSRHKKQKRSTKIKAEKHIKRKQSVSYSDFKSLVSRTQKILQLYKQRQQQWKRQKTSLLNQLQFYRDKPLNRTLATSTSTYLHKKEHLY